MNKEIALAALAASVALGLSACTAPTPDVTAWTGTTSVNTAATCWAPESTVGAAVKQCIDSARASQPTEIPTLSVTPGNVVGVNVDADVASLGWMPSIGGQSLATAPLTQTYFRFTYPNVATPPGGYVLAITAKGGSGNSDRGIWLFRLVPSGVQ